jgi:hypothetical protein
MSYHTIISKEKEGKNRPEKKLKHTQQPCAHESIKTRIGIRSKVEVNTQATSSNKRRVSQNKTAFPKQTRLP